MFSEMSDTYVDMAALAEYIAARDQHGKKYRDDEEAAIVLREEMLEVYDEAKKLFDKADEGGFWTDLDKIEEYAKNCLKESAQVLAVIKKWKYSNE